jgi:STAS-like domain of unknown function (DUF4325)
MVKIEILSHVTSASTYEDGGKIYDLIKNQLQNGENVELSFIGIASVPSAFVNAAIIQLLEHFEFNHIRTHLRFVNTTRHINQLIKSRFDFAVSRTTKSV